jgi:hypothetical protein
MNELEDSSMLRLLMERGIDSADRNRILTIAYLSVLACCCVTPCLYYFRALVAYNRESRQNQNALIAALASHADTTSTTAQPEAVRNERRALIVKLMEPVRMVCEYCARYFHSARLVSLLLTSISVVSDFKRRTLCGAT